MYLPRAYTHQARFRAAVERVAKSFAPHVVDIVTTFEDDWTGEPAVFLMVILDDADAGRDQLLRLAKQVKDAIDERVEPMEKWGVFAYFNFRTVSEQAQLDETALA